MVDYSTQNLAWLSDMYNLQPKSHTETADATNNHWQQPIDLVASETYLGRPFTTTPSNEILAQTVTDCNLILKKFLQNIHDQLEPGTKALLGCPRLANPAR